VAPVLRRIVDKDELLPRAAAKRTMDLAGAPPAEAAEPTPIAAEAMFYLDERFVGQSWLYPIPAGGKTDLSFGPIEGLRLARRVVDSNAGDRGVIRNSTEQSEAVRIDVENLTDAAWPMLLIDRVPYSEQEDLKIAWKADPAPDATDLDGRRGVLEWRFDLAAGATPSVDLSHRMTWPEDKILR